MLHQRSLDGQCQLLRNGGEQQIFGYILQPKKKSIIEPSNYTTSPPCPAAQGRPRRRGGGAGGALYTDFPVFEAAYFNGLASYRRMGTSNAETTQPHPKGLQPKGGGPAKVEVQAPHRAKSLSCEQLRRLSPNNTVVNCCKCEFGIVVINRSDKLTKAAHGGRVVLRIVYN